MKILQTALVVALLNVPVHAQPAVTASDGWAAEPGTDGTVAVYLSVQNPTMYDIYLAWVTSDAGKAEFRDGDKPVKEITVSSYGSKELKPGGAFVRLSDLKKPIKIGDTVEITLTTEGGIVLKVSAVVRKHDELRVKKRARRRLSTRNS